MISLLLVLAASQEPVPEQARLVFEEDWAAGTIDPTKAACPAPTPHV